MSKTYTSIDEAAADGYDIPVGRKRFFHTSRGRLKIKDESGFHSWGYEYAAYDENDNLVAESHTVWTRISEGIFGLRFHVRFRSDELHQNTK